MKKNIASIFISLFFIISIDFFFGKKILHYLYSLNFIDSPMEVKLQRKAIEENERSYRIQNTFFHHSLKPNIKVDSNWGGIKYKTCTNKYGFRENCSKENFKNNNLQNILFIGDSFTEGLGLDYEKTFVGLYEKYSKDKVLNLAVTSYSPIIYFNKIKYYLDRGLQAKHVIVFIDISDIDDEKNYYKICEDGKHVCDVQPINNLSKITNIGKTEEQNFLPLMNFLKQQIRKVKKRIKPENYIYRRNFQRSSWTYLENNFTDNQGINNAINYMTKLSNYLNNRNIKLSIGVYPHPATLLYDTENSLQVKIWSDFCEENGCENFINLFPTFFSKKSYMQDSEIIDKYYIKQDIHFNESGNQEIFDKIKNLNFGAPGRI